MTQKSLICSLTRSTLPFQIGLYVVRPHENFLSSPPHWSGTRMGQYGSTANPPPTEPPETSANDEKKGERSPNELSTQTQTPPQVQHLPPVPFPTPYFH